MSTVSSTDRREFLRLLSRLCLVGISQSLFLSRVFAKNDPTDRLCDKLSKAYECLESARVVGREYLRIVPEEAQKKILLDLVCRGSTSNKAKLLSSDIPTMRKLLQQSIRKDFETGRTVFINGWMLSQTESRVCALTVVST